MVDGRLLNVALNTWWDGDVGERYWMEVATSGAMGELLIAPKFDGADWSYKLVSQVREGDVILHWISESGFRGLAGWSVVTGSPEVTKNFTWTPRGRAGHKNGPRTTDAWQVSLGGLNEFTTPVMGADLQGRRIRSKVLGLKADLEADYGKPVYFPFYLYGGRDLRAQQGYLMKFPAALVDLLPALEDAASVSAEASDYLPEEGQGQGTKAPKGKVTRIQDPALRSAIENHAVDAAVDYYKGLGGTGFKKLGKPYDVRLTLDGVERHVEVKGSSVLIDTVELTINEVAHADDHQPTDLVVVDQIDYERTSEGIMTDGGVLRIWKDWKPLEEDLSPRRFAYRLPAD